MKNLNKTALFAVMLLSSTLAMAEPVNGSQASVEINTTTVGKAPVVEVVQSIKGTNTAVFETQQDTTTDALNTAALEMGNLMSMGYTSKMLASSLNQSERLVPTIENIVANATKFLDRLAESAPKYKAQADAMNARLSQVYAYNFGPKRIDSIDISQVSNEGKGEVVVGRKVNAEGNVVDEGHILSYFVAPGLTATKQNEREVIVVDRLADGEYKVAIGIFYAGQETVSLSWDPRTYTRVDYFLDYHNVNKDGKSYLTCGDSICVPFSENKSVRK